MGATGKVETSWPEPYLQSHDTQDCEFYASAYIARCLGFPKVTADDVRRWAEYAARVRNWFVPTALGVPVERAAFDNQTDHDRRFWLGPGTQEWVADQLRDRIALASVWRVQTMAHAVVALEARPDGVLLMDPWSGFVVEPWDWFLSVGPGRGNAGRTHAVEFFVALDRRASRAA